MTENLNLKTVETVDTRPFRKLVMTIGELPTSFIESMTYYELLAWFTNYLETVIIPTVNNNGEAVEELQNKFIELKADTEQEIADFEDATNTEIDRFETELNAAFTTLKNYVDNYFDNLDVQEEINNKLDQMAEDGVLQEIITTYIQSNVAWMFDTVSDMKLATNLVAGSYAQTLGFYDKTDNGGSIYIIREKTEADTINEINLIAVNDANLLAELLITSSMNLNQFGAKGNGINDDTANIQTAINLVSNINGKLFIPKGTYSVRHLNLNSNLQLYGEGTNSVLKGNKDATADEFRILLGLSKDNMILANFKIDVNSAERTNITGQDVGISINGGNNNTIDNVTIVGGSTTDSYCIRVGQNNNLRPTNITIKNCELYVSQNGFNGIAVTAGKNIWVKNNTIHNNYSNTGFAIDVEANTTSDTSLDNYRINEIYVLNNVCDGSGIGCMGAANPYNRNIIIANNIINFTNGNTSMATEALQVNAISYVNIYGNQILYANSASSTATTPYSAVRLNGTNLVFNNNHVEAGVNCYSLIRSIGAGGISVDNITISNNTLDTGSNETARVIFLVECVNFSITNNIINSITDYILHCVKTTPVSGNCLISGNRMISTKGRGLYIRNHTTGLITGNYIECFRNYVEGFTNVNIANNCFGRISSSYEVFENDVKTDNTNFVYNGNQVTINGTNSIWNSNTNEYYALNVPSTGSWKKGDLVRKSNPAANNPIGWICTESGTPGTWVALPNL